MYLTSTKWLWDPHVEKHEKKKIMGMGVCRIIEQMGKVDFRESNEDYNSSKLTNDDIELKVLWTSTKKKH
jgi:hypothetical protein